MRRRLLVGLLPVATILAIALIALSAPAVASSSARTQSEEVAYWQSARRLLAQRLRTIAAIREALLLPDPEVIAEIDFELYRNRLAVDRFLERFATHTDTDCHRQALTSVYCALAETQAPVDRLFSPLSQQQAAIADLPPSSFIAGSAPDAVVIGTPAEPDRLALSDSGQTQPFSAVTPLLSVTAKPPRARAPLRSTPPAYSPPPALIAQLDAIARSLEAASQTLPIAFALYRPTADASATPAASFASPLAPSANASEITPSEADLNEMELTTIPPATASRPNPTGNRLLPAQADYSALRPAAPLTARPGLPNAVSAEFVPSLLLEIAGDQLAIASLNFDLGAIADLGTVDFETLSLESALALLDPRLRPAFRNYRPPETFAQLHADRQRAHLGKNGGFGIADGVATAQPAIAGRVYLFRSIQYDLPEFVENGRALYPAEQRDLAQVLMVPSFDAAIAIELLATTADGGYQARWRVLEQFPDPQIVDLYNYVNYGDVRSPSWSAQEH